MLILWEEISKWFGNCFRFNLKGNPEYIFNNSKFSLSRYKIYEIWQYFTPILLQSHNSYLVLKFRFFWQIRLHLILLNQTSKKYLMLSHQSLIDLQFKRSKAGHCFHLLFFFFFLSFYVFYFSPTSGKFVSTNMLA